MEIRLKVIVNPCMVCDEADSSVFEQFSFQKDFKPGMNSHSTISLDNFSIHFCIILVEVKLFLPWRPK
jgi:hypothetical protein